MIAGIASLCTACSSYEGDETWDLTFGHHRKPLGYAVVPQDTVKNKEIVDSAMRQNEKNNRSALDLFMAPKQ